MRSVCPCSVFFSVKCVYEKDNSFFFLDLRCVFIDLLEVVAYLYVCLYPIYVCVCVFLPLE